MDDDLLVPGTNVSHGTEVRLHLLFIRGYGKGIYVVYL